ncbi:hypothetical protein VNO80_22627 [Phaseolus coccineus]|uniref:Uncharacterized protein n=1 Tax=Phaseolus coccineus TaxID=3886 RepID=A0AAN9QYX2_PHACN
MHVIELGRFRVVGSEVLGHACGEFLGVADIGVWSHGKVLECWGLGILVVGLGWLVVECRVMYVGSFSKVGLFMGSSGRVSVHDNIGSFEKAEEGYVKNRMNSVGLG